LFKFLIAVKQILMLTDFALGIETLSELVLCNEMEQKQRVPKARAAGNALIIPYSLLIFLLFP
jgi:hypothetical protein